MLAHTGTSSTDANSTRKGMNLQMLCSIPAPDSAVDDLAPQLPAARGDQKTVGVESLNVAMQTAAVGWDWPCLRAGLDAVKAKLSEGHHKPPKGCEDDVPCPYQNSYATPSPEKYECFQ